MIIHPIYVPVTTVKAEPICIIVADEFDITIKDEDLTEEIVKDFSKLLKGWGLIEDFDRISYGRCNGTITIFRQRMRLDIYKSIEAN